jgi:hypothetical protein
MKIYHALKKTSYLTDNCSVPCSKGIATTIEKNLRRGPGQPPRGSHVMDPRLLCTGDAPAGRAGFPAEKLTCHREVNSQNAINVMGDKSPKSSRKKSTQKQAKASGAEQVKKQAIANKQAAGKKK